MSVINQMLKDIEKRSQKGPKRMLFSSGLMASSSFQNNRLIYWCLGGLFFSIVSIVSLHKVTHHQSTQPLHYQLIKNTAHEKVILLPEKKLSAVPMNAPSVLTGITLQVQQNVTTLSFLTNQDILYRINYDKKNNRLILFLERTQLLSSLPSINYQNSAIKDMHLLNQTSGDLKIIIHLYPEIEPKELNWIERSKFPKLQLGLAFSNINLDKQTSEKSLELQNHSIKKLVVDMTIEEHYNKALALLSVGATLQAKNMLQELIVNYPDYHLARVALAKIFIQEGNEAKAEKILELGMQLQPRYLPYIELKARILADANKTQEALNLMQTLTPPFEENVDYYAFIAALYQRQGNSRMAARLYEQLLQFNTNKAAWWVGLGIAFNGLNRHSEALDAFTKASRAEDLTPELNDYIGNQIQNS